MTTTLFIDGMTTWLLCMGALCAAFALLGLADEAAVRWWRRKHGL